MASRASLKPHVRSRENEKIRVYKLPSFNIHLKLVTQALAFKSCMSMAVDYIEYRFRYISSLSFLLKLPSYAGNKGCKANWHFVPLYNDILHVRKWGKLLVYARGSLHWKQSLIAFRRTGKLSSAAEDTFTSGSPRYLTSEASRVHFPPELTQQL